MLFYIRFLDIERSLQLKSQQSFCEAPKRSRQSKPKLDSHYIGDRSSQYQPNSSKSFSGTPKKSLRQKEFFLASSKKQ
ncbi:MAG: hypothetical protein F6K40_23695 [Okeania sp. SIO3I5]|uniref:hypothetical protein n=1 Tax=Okeania sp. SIO3I5 TaxID=2607805 RepID=UPI0013BA0B55|nr:hypothetical protein [Okeania sp. SIO3I5]NEQ39097.1 hypothetical protein [Okeania sp. SIO3I5]